MRVELSGRQEVLLHLGGYGGPFHPLDVRQHVAVALGLIQGGSRLVSQEPQCGGLRAQLLLPGFAEGLVSPDYQHASHLVARSYRGGHQVLCPQWRVTRPIAPRQG